MLYLEASMSCFDSGTCFFVGILSTSISVHNIVGAHSLFEMIGVSLGDVGGDRRQFYLEVPLF